MINKSQSKNDFNWVIRTNLCGTYAVLSATNVQTTVNNTVLSKFPFPNFVLKSV